MVLGSSCIQCFCTLPDKTDAHFRSSLGLLSSCSNSSWITMAGRRLCIALCCTSIVPLGSTVHGHSHFNNWSYGLLHCTVHGAALINYTGPSVNLERDSMDDYGYIYIMPYCTLLHKLHWSQCIPGCNSRC